MLVKIFIQITYNEVNTTGEKSYMAKFCNFDIMFHVSTLLPFNPKDKQQIERKRHM